MTTNYCVYYDETKFKEIANVSVDTQDPESWMSLILFNILDKDIYEELDELYHEDKDTWKEQIVDYFNIDPKALGDYCYSILPGQSYNYIDTIERMCDGWVIAFTIIHTADI